MPRTVYSLQVFARWQYYIVSVSFVPSLQLIDKDFALSNAKVLLDRVSFKKAYRKCELDSLIHAFCLSRILSRILTRKKKNWR